MITATRPFFAAIPVFLLIGGCATVPRGAGFSDVQQAVDQRIGQRVQWNRLTADDREVAASLQRMLAQPLTADAAVQIALLNNRNLQATYEDLGVGQADVVQAGLLRNPVFDGDVKFPEGGGDPKIEMTVTQDFLDIFFIPLRRKVAEDQFEIAKLRVTGAVLDLTAQVRAMYVAHEAAEQTLELRRTVTAATEASYDLARR